MAVDSSFQKEHQIREFVDGSGNVAVGLKLHNKPSSDDLNRQFPLEIPPILFEETSLPAGLHSSHAQDVYSISVLPEENENANCASPLAFLSILEVPNQVKNTMCLDAHINCQNCIDFQMKNEDVYSQCIVDIPSVNGNSVSPESYEEAVESFKTGNSPTSVLWRESSFKGGKLMQSLVNVGNPRDFVLEQIKQSLRSYMIYQVTDGEDINVLPHLIPEKLLFCFQFCQVSEHWY
ncbi:uncharacterized protein LOC114382550 isoform X2 [Glycine soja]|uniref:uncharacterized protein LOC114382550 isoform X2 n=1 Tax=Glycine soja TaxID=3848 RepID=UPI0007190780|nr:uncharacterized protein LOC114382550 isoform X2 [Glycine soja]|eukprot:XP_014618987.1 uncharacterized protein LOC100788279 isoform X1 [Glycine max]